MADATRVGPTSDHERSGIRFLLVGDDALCVEFGQTIDPGLSDRVLALDERLAEVEWVVETVPTYRSLLVRYDPSKTTYDNVADRLRALAATPATDAKHGRTWIVPVSYGGEHGIDLDATAELHGITADELVRRHAAPDYRVYMIGFLPGFAYLGGLDPSIATPRRTVPRLKTPAGTISIGGVQALVGSLEAPSGWHLLGRTPVRNFMAERDPPVLISAGDTVRFKRIPAGSFDELDRRAAAGEPVAEIAGPGIVASAT